MYARYSCINKKLASLAVVNSSLSTLTCPCCIFFDLIEDFVL